MIEGDSLIDNSWGVEPADYSDLSQADIVAMVGQENMRWTYETDWLYYDGTAWRRDKKACQRVAQDITRLQVEKANQKIRDAEKEGDKDKLNSAKKFRDYAIREKNSVRLKAALEQAEPQLVLDVNQLDSDPFLLNTPNGSINLITGEKREHYSKDYCTHVTAVDPGNEGKEMWNEFLDSITCSNPDLIDYLQISFGRALIGRVFQEGLTILYGKGGNGKSSLTNAIKLTLGDYAIQVSPNLLISSNTKDKSSQMEVFRGTRLVLTSELEYGMQLDSAALKQLTSTDDIYCNPKFREPYSFLPTHTLFLSTNFLPRVSSQDQGTWDRISVVPFEATFRGTKDEMKNMGETLFENCGPSILDWLIKGAKRFCDNCFIINPPEKVKAVTEEFHAQNDWLSIFLSSCCDTGSNYSIQSSKLYGSYRDFCSATGAYPETQKTFSLAMESRGFKKIHINKGNHFIGLKLIEAVPDESDPTGFDSN